jgi:hypothetical protein
VTEVRKTVIVDRKTSRITEVDPDSVTTATDAAPYKADVASPKADSISLTAVIDVPPPTSLEWESATLGRNKFEKFPDKGEGADAVDVQPKIPVWKLSSLGDSSKLDKQTTETDEGAPHSELLSRKAGEKPKRGFDVTETTFAERSVKEKADSASGQVEEQCDQDGQPVKVFAVTHPPTKVPRTLSKPTGLIRCPPKQGRSR